MYKSQEHTGNLIVIDGDCTFCNRTVDWIRKNDRNGTFEFARFKPHSGSSDSAVTDPGISKPTSVVFLEEGKRYTESTAALRIARKMDMPWPLLYPLVAIPSPVRDFVYQLISRYRYRIFGKTEKCSLPVARNV